MIDTMVDVNYIQIISVEPISIIKIDPEDFLATKKHYIRGTS